jgi:hypothetical protein
MHKQRCFSYAHTAWAECGMLGHVQGIYTDSNGVVDRYVFGPPQLCYLEFDRCDSKKEVRYDIR